MSLKNTLFIFDIDGTLTDSVMLYLISVTRSLQYLGIKDIDTDYNNYKHHTDSYALRYNYERNFSSEYPKNLLEEFEKNLVTQMQSMDNVREIRGARLFIEFCKENKIPFCFATGGLPEPSKLKLDQCNIWYDDKLLATSKTHETREGFVMDAINRAKGFYQVQQFSNMVSVGDGLWDLKTAQNLSLDFIGIGEKNQQKFRKLGIKKSFMDIEELKHHLF